MKAKLVKFDHDYIQSPPDGYAILDTCQRCHGTGEPRVKGESAMDGCPCANQPEPTDN